MSGILLLGLRILAAMALYAFIGWALYLLWNTLRQDAAALSSRQAPPITLILPVADGQPQTLSFTRSDISIGRDADCECRLADSTVSAHHARLTFHHQQWWIDDLQSMNGTKLNDLPLRTPAVVTNGDTITCGKISMTIVLDTESPRNEGE